MTTKLITWASGVTERTTAKCPKGAVTLCVGVGACDDTEPKLRLAYDGKTMLVPGVPEAFYGLSEAEGQKKAMDALLAFRNWIDGGEITNALVMG